MHHYLNSNSTNTIIYAVVRSAYSNIVQTSQHGHHSNLFPPPAPPLRPSPAINVLISPTHSLTPSIACLAIPPTPLFALPPDSRPGETKLLPSPVAYSEPMVGSTFSPADSATNSAKGTSHTKMPKKDAISLNDASCPVSYRSSYWGDLYC